MLLMVFSALLIFLSHDGLNIDKEALFTSPTESHTLEQQGKQQRAQECAYSKLEPASDSDNEAMSAISWTFSSAADAIHPLADRVERSGYLLGTDAIMIIQLRMRSCIHLVSGTSKCDLTVTHMFR